MANSFDQLNRNTTQSISRNGRPWLLDALFGFVLLIVVLAAYQPAWHGGYLPDDKITIQRRDLHSWHGLYRIWFDPRATLQYYPLAHSAVWLQHKFWGDDTLGYHIVNIFLHVASAVLVMFILRRLKIPGAHLAAIVFAVHPVQVESVAWMVELKNVLSTVFYLAAALVYLRFDETRKKTMYWGTFALFVLSLLSKSIACTWPAAMLVIFWWKRGRLSWRQDVLPLLPFFILGVTDGVFVAKLERTEWCVDGSLFDWTPLQRLLMGGRAFWFYLSKLFWPSSLIWGYPRWDLNPQAWWQYLFPAAVILVFLLAWKKRHRWRGPLAALLFFTGSLLPFLGLFNCAYFIVSYVADHFQYQACLGIIVFVCAVLASFLKKSDPELRRGGHIIAFAVLMLLTILTWRQCQMYVDQDVFFQKTLTTNPECPCALTMIGFWGIDRNPLEAKACFHEAIRIDPKWSSAYIGLGQVCEKQGQIEEAIANYQKSIDVFSRDYTPHLRIAEVRTRQGRNDEAIEHYRRAMEIESEDPQMLNALGQLLAKKGDLNEAKELFQKAIACYGPFAGAHNNLGKVLASQGRIDDAIAHYRQALEIKPEHVEAHFNLAEALASKGNRDEALVQYEAALQLNPRFTPARNRLNAILAQ